MVRLVASVGCDPCEIASISGLLALKIRAMVGHVCELSYVLGNAAFAILLLL